MLFHDSSYFQLSFIYHNHHGQKAIKYYIPDFYKTTEIHVLRIGYTIAHFLLKGKTNTP